MRASCRTRACADRHPSAEAYANSAYANMRSKAARCEHAFEGRQIVQQLLLGV